MFEKEFKNTNSEYFGAKDNKSPKQQGIEREEYDLTETKISEDEEFLKEKEKKTNDEYEPVTKAPYASVPGEHFFPGGEAEEFVSEDPTENLDRKITRKMLLRDKSKYIKLSEEELNDLDPVLQKMITEHNENVKEKKKYKNKAA